ncbi:MAG TPA: S-layer homology domain-containing protein, partial [Brevibacillus sp.]|nr:S-layer homology domain-containing protein [Brevibacillus sp.]
SPTGTVTTGKPEFSGTATPGATITVKVAEGITLITTADENGNWSVTPTTDIPDGDYNVVVTAEKDGKVSEPITKAIKVDAATLTVAIEQPTGSKVSNAKPTFKGTATPGSEVTVEIKDKAGNVVDTPTVTVDADGNWTFTPTNNLTDGQYTVEVTATKDGKSTKATKSITVDTAPTLPSVDKTALQAKVDQIKDENLTGDDYTSESWEVLEKALEKAVSVLDDPFATQQEVDATLSTLKDAYNGLEKVSSEVDKSKLQAKVDEIEAEKLIADDYTNESWSELEKALERATSVLADPEATQKEVDAALSALKDAYNGLEKVSSEVDKSKLQAKVDEIAAENLDEDDYTKESWRELEKALEKAEAVLADSHATQKEVDAALSALKKAREGLKKSGEPTVDKSKLEAKVDEIVEEDLDEDDYTGSSWRKLEKALKQAKDVLADPDATQDEVDEALAELKKARRDLTTADKQGSGRDKNRDRDKGDAYNVSNPFFSEDGSSVGQQKPSEPTKVEDKNDYTGYMNGYPTGKFDPNRQVTRAEMAMILANTGMINPETSASGTFYDVDNGHWAADAIKRANEAGLMNGYANGTFNPQGGITRAEMATIVYKYLGLTGDGMPNNFNDVPADHWATQIIAAVSESGLMNGYPDGTFHPQKTLTRAETVTIINRLTNKIQLSPVNGQSWPDVPPTHWAYKDIEAATKK